MKILIQLNTCFKINNKYKRIINKKIFNNIFLFIVMKCWICFEKTYNICCNCKNEYRYAHNYCINRLTTVYKIKRCIFCKKKYSFSYIFYILYNLYNFCIFIGSYDIENGTLWEEYDYPS